MTLSAHVAFSSVLYLGGATLFGYRPDWIRWGLATLASLPPETGDRRRAGGGTDTGAVEEVFAYCKFSCVLSDANILRRFIADRFFQSLPLKPAGDFGLSDRLIVLNGLVPATRSGVGQMIKSLLFFIALGAGIATATGAERRETVPARFLGEWNSKLQYCGTDRNDSRLQLDANRIRFHESGGPIRAVVTQGELELALIVELSGEGETWLACNRFRLSADHEQLIDVTGDAEFVRYRCPKRAK